MLTVDKGQLAAILEKLKTLNDKVGKKAVRTASRKAMLPVRNQVKATAPEDRTNPDKVRIKAAVRLRSKWRGNTLRTRIGIEGGAKQNRETPFYFRFQEFGTKNIPAKPFLVPALETNEQQVYDTLVDELTKALFT